MKSRQPDYIRGICALIADISFLAGIIIFIYLIVS
jgi:hypothetical protein